jgi:hypothetical protein
MKDFEKLGVFYLGKIADRRPERPEPILYDSKDLTTHGVIVGMTGSGKTGLGIALIEEAAIDGIPTIAIDPKGDLGNLLLTFPELAPADFAPWVEEGAPPRLPPRRGRRAWPRGARAGAHQEVPRRGRSRDLHAGKLGRPVDLHRALAAVPQSSVMDDEDARREKINGTVSGLLALLAIDADPLRSREHILISRLVENAWSAAKDVDLAASSATSRSLRSSASVSWTSSRSIPRRIAARWRWRSTTSWLHPDSRRGCPGEPLDGAAPPVDGEGSLACPSSRSRICRTAERMFFVTLLLNEIVAWMRGQSAPRVCARCSTWTRFSASSHRSRIRPRRSRC